MEVEGAVQGVGFRPFVYRLARDLDLPGWVINDAHGVSLEVEGDRKRLEEFLDRLQEERPPRCVLHAVTPTWLDFSGFLGFEIRHSEREGDRTAVPLPDVATCSDCLAEIFEPQNRRYRYPFTNCTNCGPRFTILEDLPYDRPATTMRRFTMCPECQREYDDPADRRFHAQPNACPACGPRLALLPPEGEPRTPGRDILTEAAEALRDGRIVAVQGLGGFHLMVDATNAQAVSRLRRRKNRPDKPLAVMVRSVEHAREVCEVDEETAPVLDGPEAPIVLLPRRSDAPPPGVVEGVAPGLRELGLLLPSTPLHHLLMAEVDRPVVATSGNRSEEPIATDPDEARRRLGHVADLFLVHDRPIARHADDSVMRWIAGGPSLIRRARGYAPLPVVVASDLPPVLAVGGHLKNVVAFSQGRNVFLSQHLGDLETPETRRVFEHTIDDLLRLQGVEPVAVACDFHPDYSSTRWAEEAAHRWDVPRIPVQHHHAHLVSCLAEHGEPGPALGIVWDGTGYGADGTIWGGELLLGDWVGFRRVGCLRPFHLAGGERAIAEPWRIALALVRDALGPAALEGDDLPPLRQRSPAEIRLLDRMLDRGFHAPVTTSMGRLFDGVSALLGLVSETSFEAQAAMLLEHRIDPTETGVYPLPVEADERARLLLDWRPTIRAVVDDLRRGTDVGRIAARFHRALAHAASGVAQVMGVERVALSGGCFHNRFLTEELVRRLEDGGFRVLLHRRVPAGDGGLALGQLAVAAARLQTARDHPQRWTGKEVPPCVSEFPVKSSASTPTPLAWPWAG